VLLTNIKKNKNMIAEDRSIPAHWFLKMWIINNKYNINIIIGYRKIFVFFSSSYLYWNYKLKSFVYSSEQVNILTHRHLRLRQSSNRVERYMSIKYKNRPKTQNIKKIKFWQRKNATTTKNYKCVPQIEENWPLAFSISGQSCGFDHHFLWEILTVWWSRYDRNALFLRFSIWRTCGFENCVYR
jgi:hypothetical protein